jgi:hypothetical protein
MKRADGHAIMVGGDRDQVVARIVDLYTRIATSSWRPARNAGSPSAPPPMKTWQRSAGQSGSIARRGEIAAEEAVHCAIDQNGQSCDLSLAAGDRVRLFRRTSGNIDGRDQQVGNNGDVIEILGQTDSVLRMRTKQGQVANIEWRRLREARTDRLFLGFGHALTIDAAQGITSEEHIDALPRGTAGLTAFKIYVAESRSRITTWTVIGERALHKAARHRQALGDITSITRERLWERAPEPRTCLKNTYKALGTDLLGKVLRNRDAAIDANKLSALGMAGTNSELQPDPQGIELNHHQQSLTAPSSRRERLYIARYLLSAALSFISERFYYDRVARARGADVLVGRRSAPGTAGRRGNFGPRRGAAYCQNADN